MVGQARERRAPQCPTSANTNGLDTLVMANGWLTQAISSTAPLLPTAAMPKRSGSTRASAG